MTLASTAASDIGDLRLHHMAREYIRRWLDYGPEAASLWLYEMSLENDKVLTEQFRTEVSRARKAAGLCG